jgi:hypothetical protein
LKNDPNENKSYFAVYRRRRKRNLMIFIPITASVVVLGFFAVALYGPSASSNIMVMHNHANLTVAENGLPVTVPAHIGMSMVGTGSDPLLYGDHSLDKFGMQGMSPLHTHDSTGLIHVESNTARNFTLGEFLDIWKGLAINGKPVIAKVDGKPVSDFRNILLKDKEEISLDIKSIP